MTNIEELMQEESDSKEDTKWEEKWLVIMTTKGKYTLSKMQALILKQALATGSRSTIVFDSFVIAIPYIVEFYRTRRFLKNTEALPATASEVEYKPISSERWETLKKQMTEKIRIREN